MSQKYSAEMLREEVVKAKDQNDRRFRSFTDNFYIMRAALRYFSVKKGMSFTSSKVADNFPLTVAAAGSSLKVLDHLDVVEHRSKSSSPNRYMPQNVDMERLRRIEEILIESYEIKDFYD